MNFIKVFINRPIFLLMVEAFLIVLGIVGYNRLGVDFYPKIDPPVVTITTSYPGAGPEEVELLVTKVLEEEINQIGGIDRLISTSREGISQVVVEFDLDRDAKEAQTDVREKVSRVRPNLPDEAEEPLILRLDFEDRPILQYALRQTGTSEKVSEAQLRLAADNLVKPLLQKIDGVGQINIFGGQEREIKITLEKQKLLLWKLTPTDVAVAIRKSNLNVPAGEMKEEPVSRSIRLVGEYSRISEIDETVVKVLPGGRPVTIADLGTTLDTYKERDSFARLDDAPVVMLEVKKESDGNTVEVAERLQAEIGKINERLPAHMEIAPVYDGARRIRNSVNDVLETMLIAAILAVVVVFLFLGSLQSTFITGIALPTTIIASFYALYVFGFTLNVMTLLGMTLAVGLLLDDAIVVRENIWKKIESGMPAKEAAFRGSKEVYIAVLATSLTVLAVFVPVTFIPGIVGRFFANFALTVCICVIFSTFDALTMAPTLSALMVPSRPRETGVIGAFHRWRTGFGNYVLRIYEAILSRSLKRPALVLGLAGLLFVGSLGLVPLIGFTFMPSDESGEIQLKVEAPPGTTIYKSNEIALEIEKELKKLREIEYFSARIGNEYGDKNIASIFIRMVPEDQRTIGTEQMRTKLREKFSSLFKREDLTVTVGRPGGGGPGKPVAIVIEGNNIDALYSLSQQITAKVQNEVEETVNMESNLKPGRTELQLTIDRTRTAAFALDTEVVGQTIRGLFEGQLAGKYREEGEEYDIRVQLRPEEQFGVSALKEFAIPNQRGEAIPLFAITSPNPGISPTKIIRIDQQRAVMVTGDLAEGAALGRVLQKLRKIVEPMLPAGYNMRFEGQAEALADLRIGAITALLLGALFIYMIMASLYESLVIPFSILLTLPLAIIGALLALFVTGKFLDVYAVIGIILLMGLVTKNAILLVDYAEQLRRQGMERNEALLEAGLRRIRPIMMTTLAMVAGMMPIALGMGELNKFRVGMGIGAIGGLVTSTLLSLVVVPCFYIYLDRMRRFVSSRVSRVYQS